MRKLTFVLFCTFTILLHSCQNYEDFNEIDRVNYTPEFAVPLISSTLSLEDVLEEQEALSFLTVDTDGSMSINYSKDQIQKQASEFIQEIEDFPIILPDSFISVPVNLFDNLSVSKLKLKSGTITFDIQSSHAEDIDLRITFPGMTQNGMPFNVQKTIEYQGSTPIAVAIEPVSINDYELDMPNGELDIRYEAFNTNGERVLLDLITGAASNWEYSRMEGIWTQESFALRTDTIEIDLFKDWVDGQVSLADPKLIIDLSNSIGFPVQMRINNMTAHTSDGNTIPFSSVLEEGYNMSYPGLSDMDPEKSDQIILDRNNSNIISIFNAQPKFITYEVIAVMNPEDSNEVGFISDNSSIKGGVNLELPIYGTASDFTFENDSDFEMEDIENVSYAEFKLITNNSIPLDLDIQLYFTDENGNLIDSLFEENHALLTAPEIAANGTIMKSSEQSNIIMVDAARFEKIQSAKKVKVKASISTANDASIPVKILNTQNVEIRMGAKIGVD